eukprot:CFRG0409T1
MAIHTVSIVGAGRVGTVLTHALLKARYDVVTVMSRTLGSAQRAVEVANATNTSAVDNIAHMKPSDLILLTVPDEQIRSTTDEIAKQQWLPKSLVHCSGSKSSVEIEFVAEKGVNVASLHPLQSFADPATAISSLPGTYWALEGTDELHADLTIMIERLQGICLPINKEQKVAYHAGAVLACNYLYSLESIATKVMSASGIPPDLCLKALLPLIQGTVNNMASVGLPQSLSGPISRGDSDIVKNHLNALSQPDMPSNAKDVYRILGHEAVSMATKQIPGINTDQAKQLHFFLTQ